MSSMKIAHFVLIGQQTWPPHAILVSDWSISKKSSPLKLLRHMNRNLVGSIYMYGRLCIKFPQSRMKGERHRLSPLSLQFFKPHGVKYCIFTSSAVDGVKSKTEIGICCFSAKHTALRSESKDWLGQNQNNVSRVEQHVYLCTVVSASQHYKIQLRLLVQYKVDVIIIST